jgi:hypothetical protein
VVGARLTKKPKKIKTRNGKTDRRKNGRQERAPSENRPGVTEREKKTEPSRQYAVPPGQTAPLQNPAEVDGGARRQACRRSRSRATMTGDHGAPVAAIRLT